MAALALKIGQTLRNIVATYNHNTVLLYSLIGACQAIEVAWNRISAWINCQSLTTYANDSSFYEQLAASIDIGKVVLDALQQDLKKHSTIINLGLSSVLRKGKVLLDENVLRDHCTRLNLQLSSLHLLLATTSLSVSSNRCIRVSRLLKHQTRTIHGARDVLCECLKPVFRKDEESAWTIVASTGRSSLHTSENVSNDVKADNESTYSIKYFSFTNDLLTAPVYKRLTLNLLSRPRTVQGLEDISPSNVSAHFANRAFHSAQPKALKSQDSAITTMRRQTVPSASSGNPREGPDALLLIDHAAGKSFSFSTVSDLEWLKAGPSDPRPSRYLPIGASLNREQMTALERHTLDLQLIDATRRGSVYEMATFLDSGADINANPSHKCETALHIATTTHQDESVVLFLLHFENANVHVRDGNGRTLLHGAVGTGKLRAVQWLLNLGLSMMEEDENGITPFHIAAEKSTSTMTLSTLLRHARMQGADDVEITEMDPTAMHTACAQTPICVGNALVLLQHGWSPHRRFRSVGNENGERMSPLYLAILGKEVSLVEKMLEQKIPVVFIHTVHGPISNLLRLTMAESGPCPTGIVLLLLRAGFDYRSCLLQLRDFVHTRNDPALLEWLDEEEVHRKELPPTRYKPKAEGHMSKYPQFGRDREMGLRREKRASIAKLENKPGIMLVL